MDFSIYQGIHGGKHLAGSRKVQVGKCKVGKRRGSPSFLPPDFDQ